MLRDMNTYSFIRMYNSIIPPANSSLRILQPPARMYHDTIIQGNAQNQTKLINIAAIRKARRNEE